MLDPVPQQRRDVALSLEANAQSLTQIMLRRLVAVRNWLPRDERQLVAQLVRSARLRGIDCAQWEAARTESILVSTVDGSGTQGIMIVTTAGDRQSVCSILAKRAVGIADAWCGGPQSRGQVKKILRETATAALSAQVPREYLDAIVQHHIQIGCEAGRVPPPGLLEVAETIGGAQWHPNALPWRALLARLCAEIPPGELAPSAVKRALAELHDAGDLESMTESWFEDDHETRELFDRARHKDFRKSVDDLLRTIIHRRAEKWAEQFAWAAYWLRQTRAFGESRWMKFAIVARALTEGVPLEQIAMMRDVASRTVTL